VKQELRSLLSVLLLSAAALCVPAAAKGLNGIVSHVTDGDTLWVRPAGGQPVQVRIYGIDAPEICQTFGKQSRDALAARVLRRPVQVATRARDVYDRNVGRVTLNGQDVGAWLVAGGYAWASRYRNRAVYAAEEAQARQERRGLWAANPQEPRLFRKRHGSCQPS
jgi:micrococcal nuclease